MLSTEKKEFRFIDGRSFLVPHETCRGCFMRYNSEKLPQEILPIARSSKVTIQQDAEWPIPGFYIVSTVRHAGSLSDLGESEFKELMIAIKKTRRYMKDLLGIERAHVYQEEKLLAPHVHFWILPLWPSQMQSTGLQPKIYDANVHNYLHSFSYSETHNSISNMNTIMRRALIADKELKMLGFT